MAQFVPAQKTVRIPGGVSATRLVSQDGRRVLVVSHTKRVWLLEITPEERRAKVVRTPLVIDPQTNPELLASHDLSRLFITEAGRVPRVVEVPSGRRVFPAAGTKTWPTPPDWHFRAWGLTPDGRYVIEINPGQARLRDLEDGDALGPIFDAWHQCEKDVGDAAATALEAPGPTVEPLLLDHVDDVLTQAVEAEEGAFFLCAPCYGYVVAHVAAVTRTPLGPVGIRWPGRTRVGPAPVYDPSAVVRPAGLHHVLVCDLFRSGLTALDPETGQAQKFPRDEGETHWYGDIYDIVCCTDAPFAWVRTKDGAFLWHLDGRDPPREPLRDSPEDVVTLYHDALLYTDGQHLAWGDIR